MDLEPSRSEMLGLDRRPGREVDASDPPRRREVPGPMSAGAGSLGAAAAGVSGLLAAARVCRAGSDSEGAGECDHDGAGSLRHSESKRFPVL